MAERTAALLESLGQSGADGEEDRLSRDDPWLAGLYAAGVSGRVATGSRAGRRVQTAGVERHPEDEPATTGPRCANAGGFSVHANVAIRQQCREQLERLCRYMWGTFPDMICTEGVYAALPGEVRQGSEWVHSKTSFVVDDRQ